MSQLKWVVCTKCGRRDAPVKPVVRSGIVLVLANTGTSTKMQCSDCSATMCRACCPTGHQTRWELE